MVFQQTCGPVQAKGVEDTAFYRWSRLVSRNEVGGDPDRLGGTPAEFHAFAGHLADCWPATMTTLSTHDTKRQEDVRARLAVLAESAPAWARAVERWHARAATLCRDRSPEADTEYLLWQTLAGAWPVSGDRLAGYLRKAMREAKTATSWISPDPGYETAVLSFAAAVLADPLLTGWIGEFRGGTGPGRPGELARHETGAAHHARRAGRLSGLRARRVRAGRSGQPAAGGFRPPRARPLARLDGPARRQAAQTHSVQPAEPGCDAEKLLVTSAALRLRRAHPDWFAGSYQPLAAQGPAARPLRRVLPRRSGGDRRHPAARRAGRGQAAGAARCCRCRPGRRRPAAGRTC